MTESASNQSTSLNSQILKEREQWSHCYSLWGNVTTVSKPDTVRMEVLGMSMSREEVSRPTVSTESTLLTSVIEAEDL